MPRCQVGLDGGILLILSFNGCGESSKMTKDGTGTLVCGCKYFGLGDECTAP